MAARIRRISVDENTRAKIQTGLLINRLTDHALGEIELQSTQIKAIEILLNKTLPSLSSTTIDGNLNLTAHEDALDDLEREGAPDQA